MKKIATLITVTILIALNIFLSFYIQNKYYNDDYEKRNIPLNNYRKTSFKKFIKSEQKELNNIFKDFFLKNNFEEEFDKDQLYFFNSDDQIHNKNIHCNDLLKKLIRCLTEENFKNIKETKCNKLVDKEIEELEKCQIEFNSDFDTYDYSQNFDNNIVYFNFSNHDNEKGNDNYNAEDDEELDKEKFLKLLEEDSYIKDKNINIISSENSNIINNNINNDDYLNKDCIEYGLSKDGFIICTKYE